MKNIAYITEKQLTKDEVVKNLTIGCRQLIDEFINDLPLGAGIVYTIIMDIKAQQDSLAEE